MINVNAVDIQIGQHNNTYSEIYKCLILLLTTPAGTVPFDRDFGIDFNVLDNPLEVAKGLLTVEYIKKVQKYESRAKVTKVTFEHEGTEGILLPKVVIELVES